MVLTPMEKAAILVEALPYIRKFAGETVVIKYGGRAMVNDHLKQGVITDCILLKLVGIHPVLVHGGGSAIDEMLRRLGKSWEFVRGQRVTDEETMAIVEMVLAGKVNKEIVALINKLGGKGIGLSGKDGNLIEARKKVLIDEQGETVDLGYVGEITRVNPEIINTVLEKGYIPVVAPIGVGENGESYNINADYVAGELAAALGANKLVLLTDVEGILADREDPESLLSVVRVSEVPELIRRGVISGGMIPKVECCVQALEKGVGRTHIIDGRILHSILLEVFTDEGVGTMVIKE
ncbi:MAG: Acetylglutamate kinase [Thermoanaerobacterales bacterium 50_218]|nr:MAG: Acetylglutamate kinase [Thermoanaerobacterales bacterium 50_218]HAA88975.1 acetylglutamate kinase [Peptococcaceae bacterium]